MKTEKVKLDKQLVIDKTKHENSYSEKNQNLSKI